MPKRVGVVMPYDRTCMCPYTWAGGQFDFTQRLCTISEGHSLLEHCLRLTLGLTTMYSSSPSLTSVHDWFDLFIEDTSAFFRVSQQ